MASCGILSVLLGRQGQVNVDVVGLSVLEAV